MEEMLIKRKDRNQVWVSSNHLARSDMVYVAFSRTTRVLLPLIRTPCRDLLRVNNSPDQNMEEFRWKTTSEKRSMMMNSIKMKAVTQTSTSSFNRKIRKSSRCSHQSSRCRIRHILGQKARFKRDRVQHRFKNKTGLKMLKMRKNLWLRRTSGLLIRTLSSRCFTKVWIQTVQTGVHKYLFQQKIISWL